MLNDLHPGHEVAVDASRPDHRSVHNREQMTIPDGDMMLYKRVVEDLAADLQIEPYDAHVLLQSACLEINKGLAWEWWL